MRKASVRGGVLLAVLMAATLVLSACGTGSSTSRKGKAPAGNQPYKIGILTTLSGPIGFLGKDVTDTAQMEAAKINAAGGVGGHKLELVIQDDGGNPSQAATGFTKLVNEDHVLAVTGTITGLESALRPLAERDHIPYVITGLSLPNMRARDDKYTFEDGPDEIVEAAAWLNILKQDHYTRVAGIGENDGLSAVLLGELKKEAAPQGITVDITPDFINVNSVDMTPQVAKLKGIINQDKDQAVVSSVWTSQVPTVLKAMKTLGISKPVILYYYGADASLLSMGGKELNGLQMPGLKMLAGSALPDSDPQRAAIVAFKKAYEAKYKRLPGSEESFTYDAIHIIADALKVSGPNPVKLRDAIEKTHGYVGVTGVISYSPTDHTGLPTNCLAIYKVVNHQFVFVREMP